MANNLKKVLFILVLGSILCSCVPNRKFVPLQSGDVNRKDLIKDSVLRTHPLSLPLYRIKPHDQLSITVETLTPDEFNFLKQLNPVLNQQNSGSGMMGIGYFVDKDGYIALPVIGKISISGLTIDEAQEKLVNTLKSTLRDPFVLIRILNYRFTFSGEINAQVTAPTPRISVLEGITMAGGFTDLSDRENLKILRQKGDKMEVLYVNLLDENFVESPNFWLQQNDIIIVPPLKQRTARQYLTQNVGLVVSLVTLVLTTINILTP